jgi:hypothetical protein
MMSTRPVRACAASGGIGTGFFSFEFWRDCLLTGADLLFRVSAGLKLPVLRALPDGSYLSEVVTHKARGSGFKVPLGAADDPRNATHIPVRVIEYTVSPAQPGGTAETSSTKFPQVDRDRTISLDEVPDGYRAMARREALKVLIYP